MAARAAVSSAGHEGGGEPLRLRCLHRRLCHRVEHAVHHAGRRERLAHGQEPLAVAGPAPRGQRAADLGPQLVADERLGEVVEGAALHGVHRRLDRAVRGHDEHGQPRLALVQALHQADAVHRLHAEVEQRQVEARILRRAQRRLRVARGHDVEAHGRQPHLEHLEDGGIVVDH